MSGVCYARSTPTQRSTVVRLRGSALGTVRVLRPAGIARQLSWDFQFMEEDQ